jgi:hypothetical protein
LTLVTWGFTHAVVVSPRETPAAAFAPSSIARRRLTPRFPDDPLSGISSGIGTVDLMVGNQPLSPKWPGRPYASYRNRRTAGPALRGLQ